MFLPRKYELFGLLYQNDEKSKRIIDEAFREVDKEIKEELLSCNYNRIPAFFQMGCGIPGDVYTSIIKGLDELDKTDLYDNKLTYRDVTDVEFESSRKGTAIQFRLVSKPYDFPYRIVGFATLCNRSGTLSIDKEWKMWEPPDYL